MSFFSNLASGISSGLHGISDFVHHIWPETPPTTTQESHAPKTESHEAETQTEPTLKNPEEDKKTEVPVRTDNGDYQNIPLHFLMNTFRLSTTANYEEKSRTLYQEIETIHNNLKKVNQFLEAFSKKLSTQEPVNLNGDPFTAMSSDLKEIGLDISSDRPLDIAEANTRLRAWEHSRDSLDQEMKMKYHKFAEVSKDREMIQQAFLAMESSLNDVLKKIAQNIR